MKISIIVPLYNVENYIRENLLSLSAQNLSSTDYEVIIVNDGTKDKSRIIAEEFIEKNNLENFRIFDQANQGLSAARNSGLKLAVGDYIWFVDSDDAIEKNCLKEIAEEAVGADVVAIGMKSVWPDKEVEEYHSEITDRVSNWNLFQPAAPTFIFNRKFLLENNFKFKEGIYHEDYELTPRILASAKRIRNIKHCYYIYNRRNDSITTTVKPKRAFDMIDNVKTLCSFADSIHVTHEKKCFYDVIGLGINNALYYASMFDDADKKKFLLYYRNNKMSTHLLKCRSKKYVIEGLIFSIIPFLSVLTLYSAFNKIRK